MLSNERIAELRTAWQKYNTAKERHERSKPSMAIISSELTLEYELYLQDFADACGPLLDHIAKLEAAIARAKAVPEQSDVWNDADCPGVAWAYSGGRAAVLAALEDV